MFVFNTDAMFSKVQVAHLHLSFKYNRYAGVNAANNVWELCAKILSVYNRICVRNTHTSVIIFTTNILTRLPFPNYSLSLIYSFMNCHGDRLASGAVMQCNAFSALLVLVFLTQRRIIMTENQFLLIAPAWLYSLE